ncbi:hypothetical protein [Rathayibacter sp. AY1E8]|uniref:hypothetical protein n=1 Tax=Rathayibacter sp. AY1E8 TaxID=2080555 RepID=UPI0011B07451|nr:hypothetical protein [Rathayibacter sp. AY1E8]
MIARSGSTSRRGPEGERQDLSRLWYADPTGEAAVRRILEADDFIVTDPAGHKIFHISRDALLSVVPMLDFKPNAAATSLRARLRKKAPTKAGATAGEGNRPDPTTTKENQ